MNRLFSNDFAPLRLVRDLGLQARRSRAGAEGPAHRRGGRRRARRAEAAARPRAVSDEDAGTGAPRTLAAQALGRIDEATRRARAAAPPVVRPSSATPTISIAAATSTAAPTTPTVREAEAVIGALEGAASTLVFGSGMSAAVALFLSLGPARTSSRRARCTGRCATGSRPRRRRFGLARRISSTPRICSRSRAAIEPGATKLVWLETPSNPLWGVSDIAGAARIAHAAGALARGRLDLRDAGLHPAARARRRRRHAFGDQISQRPFRRGRGRACASRATMRSSAARARHPQGARPHPASVRGVPADPRPADARLARAGRGGECDGARAASLQSRRRSSAVLYPGLPHHPGHEVARRQMQGGFGGMLSIRVRGGAEAAIAAAARVTLWKRATSLGGVESLHRTSRLDRRPGLALPARPAASFRRNRGRRGLVARPRAGARRLGNERAARPRVHAHASGRHGRPGHAKIASIAIGSSRSSSVQTRGVIRLAAAQCRARRSVADVVPPGARRRPAKQLSR